ncbi:hypothetical protein F4821DRAFT_249666 [Hypoxylon rubiginosum]|uniref:Uncharacterized protein n=1 Tax=Hypoxylon rubiginosum TaxID=110542 RepID=A0ACC0CLC7_9PEZI|nr:hypothetical protein F4821DRAFT_249666 [Hypoxylon rubiginosum]
MLGDPEFFFLKHWAWLDTTDYEEALLGAFVRNFADPAHEGMIPEPDELSHWAKYGKTKTLDGKFSDFVLDIQTGVNRDVSSVLKSLAVI